jgi:hypothetical protein
MEGAIFVGLGCIALAIFGGLTDIARAIRNRTIDVNVKLPPIKVTSDDGDESA